MSETIVGMMWNKNEGDILEEIIQNALSKVDSLFIADDGSTDKSWEIIQSFVKSSSKIEYVRNQRDNPIDKGQRQSLLDEIRKRYRPEDTWVQIMESDIMILDTDIREAIKDHAVHDIGVNWVTLNAVRKSGTWKEIDTYPNWKAPIKEVMPYAHWMEAMLYTFRPLPKLKYNQDMWRPWPSGFSAYIGDKPLFSSRRRADSPLLAHYGYRGPTHFHNKFKDMTSSGFHSKYKTWDIRSVDSVDSTVSFFNGQWNTNLFPMSREGWVKRKKDL